MDNVELIELSLEQCATTLGDPTERVFAHMYERFPGLAHFRSDDTSWENYMMQEILTNLMEFSADPDTALTTIKDMTAHHELIGVPLDIFKGMYRTLFEVLSVEFHGEHRDAMMAAWQDAIDRIIQCVEANS